MEIPKDLQDIIINFDSNGTVYIAGNRNIIKLFNYKFKPSIPLMHLKFNI